jgi:hypothetical protein
VGGIRVGVEQAHAHRLDPGGPEPLREAPDFRGVDRPAHRAVDEHSLVELESEVAGGDRPRPLHVEVVHVVAVLARDLDRVAEALGGDERRARALPLDDGVREEGGAVQHVGHVAGRHARRAEHGLDPRDDGVVRSVGGREDLADLEGPAVLAREDEIGERPADVGADAVGHVVVRRARRGAQSSTPRHLSGPPGGRTSTRGPPDGGTWK